MIALNRRTRVFVCKEATDMRSSYDSLFGRVKGILKGDPFSGHMFLFVNRDRSSLKCLYWDGTGFVIISKRLDRGRFSKINSMYDKDVVMTSAEFALYFEGANLEKRFIDSPSEIGRENKKVFRSGELLQTANL